MTLDRPRVPPELVDHIVDFLHADRNTLCTLTVVSKSFLPTSSLHLFNSIAIDIGSKSLQDFDDFILHASPRVQCNLKKLMVTGTPEVVSIFGRTSKQKLEIPLLACVLSHIPLLSDLVIKSVTLEGIYTAPPVTPRRLNSLSIACVRASGGPVDICSLLALFSDIRTLHIEETTWAQIRPDPDAAVHQIDRIQTGYRNVFPCTKVTNLVMSTALYTRSFLEILRRTKTPVSLTYVEVMCSCMMDTWALGDFLGHTGQTVDMVSFNITRLFEGEIPEVADHVRKCLSLSTACPSLRTLVLRLHLDLDSHRLTSAMFAVVSCLVEHAPTSLRHVVLEVDLPTTATVYRTALERALERAIEHFVTFAMATEWKMLDALAVKRCDLTRLQFVWRLGRVHSLDIAERLAASVRAKLPRLTEQRILRFSSRAI